MSGKCRHDALPRSTVRSQTSRSFPRDSRFLRLTHHFSILTSMHTLTHTIALVAAVTLASSVAHAQKSTQTGPGRGGSPHFKSEWTIDGAAIAISYGRPSLKGRPEAQVMPPGQPWRTGADTATRIVTNKPIKFGTVTLAPGTYTINTQPGEGSWQLILGKMETPGQWGVPYKSELEVGRAPMVIARGASPVEQLTISIDDTAAGATLRIEWGTAKATVPFTVVNGGP
jgi:hypothetical protein